jgi:hypothetical protein
MIFQALTYDSECAYDKRLFIEIWLDHYISGPNAFLPFLHTQIRRKDPLGPRRISHIPHGDS